MRNFSKNIYTHFLLNLRPGMCLLTLLAGMLLVQHANAGGECMVFKHLDWSDGICDNNAQWIEELPDGRMAIQTKSNVNIYDANSVVTFPRDEKFMTMLPHHHRHFVTTADDSDRLWIKEWDKIWCLDLRTGKYIKNPMVLLHPRAIDVYFDSNDHPVILLPDSVLIKESALALPVHADKIGDVMATADNIMLFDMDGGIYVRDGDEWSHYPCDGIPENQDWWYYRTFDDGEGHLYRSLSEFEFSRIDAFDIKARTWAPIVKSEMVFYGMSQPEPGRMLIGTRHGFIEVDLGGGKSSVAHAGYLPNTVTSPYNLRMLTDFHTRAESTQRINGSVGLANIHKDWQGGWWMAIGRLGVFYYHPDRNLFASGTASQLGISDNEQYLSHEREKEFWGFQKNVVNDFVIDKRGRKWYATPIGLIVKDDKDSVVITSKDGMPSNYIHNLCLDADGHLWVGTNVGICEVDYRDGLPKITNYGADDGIPHWEMIERSAIRLQDNRIAINCVEGWIAFHPDRVRHQHKRLTPLLSEVQVPGVDEWDVIPPYMKELKLSYKDNYVTVKFGTLNYAFPNNVHYKWRLKGSSNPEWMDGRENVDDKGALKLSFINLKPGKYTLEVKASDDGHTFDGDVTRLKIVILPPWWLTWWAYTIYALLAIGLVCLAFALYLRRKEKDLKQKHREEMLLQQIQQLMQSTVPQTAPEDEPIEEPNEANDIEDAEFVQSAITLVEEHLKEQYTVEQLANDLCMERTGLYKRLTTLVKKSPQTFIRSIRLNHAATMLRQGVSVTETSEATGFNSISYFSRAFTKEFGMSPSEYAAKSKD